MQRIFLILFLILTVGFTSSAWAKTMTVTGRQSKSPGSLPPRIDAEMFLVPLGGAAIKKVRNSSSLGFVIEGEGGLILYRNKGENAKGVRLGPGRYRVYPYLEHRSDHIRMELELQETGEWVTEGGRQHIQKFKPQ